MLLWVRSPDALAPAPAPARLRVPPPIRGLRMHSSSTDKPRCCHTSCKWGSGNPAVSAGLGVGAKAQVQILLCHFRKSFKFPLMHFPCLSKVITTVPIPQEVRSINQGNALKTLGTMPGPAEHVFLLLPPQFFMENPYSSFTPPTQHCFTVRINHFLKYAP